MGGKRMPERMTSDMLDYPSLTHGFLHRPLVFFDGQMCQKRVDLRLGHLRGMPDAIEVDESLDPLAVGLFRAVAVVTGPQRLAQLIK